MVGLDYRYVTTWSINLDMTLALQTARAVMRPTVEARRPLPGSVDG
jgi:lipopolysaccharide/colanic/teichoic acid biosynthesis glycosyltransferase